MPPPTQIDPTASVLFLGSGFTRDATNIRGQNVPTGDELRILLAEMLEISPSAYELRVLAEEVASQKGRDLRQLLYEIFTIKALTPDQSEILQNSWLRIYTTNYDDAIEFAHQNSFHGFNSYNYDDEKPRRLRPNSIIHLHGSVRQLRQDNALEQLVLTERSYVRQHFEKSPWYDDFDRDLRFCDACFFVGYSLSDHHIASLLLENRAVTAKTYFVCRHDVDAVFNNRVSPYGEILRIGVDGFATLCRTLPRRKLPSDLHSLKSFDYVDPHKDKKTLAPPTAVEVLNLLAFGTFNYSRSLSSRSGEKYAIPRQANLNEGVSLIQGNRCLLVHSRLGNGKSIFLYLISTALSELGYKCLAFRGDNQRLQQELAFVRDVAKVVILLDPYTLAQNSIAHLAQACPDAKFIVTVRTGVHDVRLHEIEAELPRPFARLNLNRLGAQDIDDFTQLCRIAGLGSSDLMKIANSNRELRDLLLVLFRNRFVQKRIQEAFTPVFAQSTTKRVLSALFLIHWMGELAEGAFIRAVTEVDAYAEVSRVKEVAGEIVRLDEDELQIRSAVFAEYVVQHFVEGAELARIVYDIVTAAAQRREQPRYRVLMSGLMQFSNLRRLLRDDLQKLDHVEALYEKLRYHALVNAEPLFWLQYAILMIERENLVAAEEFVATAYSRAAAIPSFRTYQIDTVACRLVLMLEAREVASPTVRRFDELVERLQNIVPMIGDESHRYYAIKVLEGVAPFVDARRAAMSTGEKNVLVYWLWKLAEELQRLPADVRAQSGSDQISRELVRAKEQLVHV
jgi:hypothetical protein